MAMPTAAPMAAPFTPPPPLLVVTDAGLAGVPAGGLAVGEEGGEDGATAGEGEEGSGDEGEGTVTTGGTTTVAGEGLGEGEGGGGEGLGLGMGDGGGGLGLGLQPGWGCGWKLSPAHLKPN